MRHIVVLLLLAAVSLPASAVNPLFAPGAAPAFQAASPSPQAASLEAETRARAVAELARLLREKYVFPEVGERAAAFLEAQLKAGKYTGETQASDFARALTRDAQSVTKDKHLNVGVMPPSGPDLRDAESVRAAQRAEGQRQNFGFAKVERLPGNVGYLELNAFMPAEDGGETAAAAMNFLANSSAVIIDLRQNGGGEPSMIQLITSYFFDRPTHLNTLEYRGARGSEQFWTLPHVPGRRMPNTPVYILTSGATFSAAEEFANNFRALKRGTLIGEVTGGGANPGEGHPLPGGLGVFMPTGRAVNPVDKSNWEGKGVEPHIKVPAGEALQVAHAHALENVVKTAKSEQARFEAQWALDSLRAQMKPVKLTAEQMGRFAGKYGQRRVTLEGNKLFYEREGRPKRELKPLKADTFAVEGLPYFRVRFVSDDSGKIAKLEGVYEDGLRDSSPRDQ